jgi:hypothetical protein
VSFRQSSELERSEGDVPRAIIDFLQPTHSPADTRPFTPSGKRKEEYPTAALLPGACYLGSLSDRLHVIAGGAKANLPRQQQRAATLNSLIGNRF